MGEEIRQAEVALITGAASGIGAAVTTMLAARGARMALLDLNGESLADVSAAIHAAHPAALLHAVAGDASDRQTVERFVREAAERLGRPTSVVACAGIAATAKVTEMSEEAFDRIMAVNTKSVFLLARASMFHLEQGGGSFIAIASDAAVNGFQGYGAYCASKHAVLGLIKALALDHGARQVRSNAICPGYVDTPMLDRLFAGNADERAFYERSVPLGRFASVEDVAHVVAFLSSPAGAYANGMRFSLDGGSTAGPYIGPV